MSYDIELWIDTGGVTLHCLGEFNITFNVNPMFQEAVGMSIRDLNGLTARQTGNILNLALLAMSLDPATFVGLEHGSWGTREQFAAWMSNFMRFCKHNPDAKVLVSY